MSESYDRDQLDGKRKLYSLFIAGAIIVLLAYAVTYLLTVSPLVVRAVGNMLGGS